MYIKSIKITTDDHYYLNDGFTIPDLRPITLLVGDQGSGKSSILDVMRRNEGLELEMTKLGANGVGFHYFNFEKDNPAINPSLDTPLAKRLGAHTIVNARWHSHGENLARYAIDGLMELEDTVVLFDEPESGLSLRNQYRLLRAARTAVSNNCQLIFATHCLPLTESVVEVFSMDHKRWMNSKKFINIQRK